MPGDLNLKKSWNPALMKNQQKVWEQEQKSLEEIKRIRQLELEFQQELETSKLLSLKNKNNQKVTKEDKLKINKMSWMYDNPNKATDTKKTAENADTKRKTQNKRTDTKLSLLDPMAAIASGIRSSHKSTVAHGKDYKVAKGSSAPKSHSRNSNNKLKIQKELEQTDPMNNKLASSGKANYLSKFNY